MAPSSSTSTTAAAAADERDRKRKRGAGGEAEAERAPKWRSRREHEIYSTRLLDALRLVRAGGGVAPSPARQVRDAADRALAVAARGRSRWSRAILASRRAHRVHRVRLHAPAPSPAPALPHRASPGASSSGSTSAQAPALARKAKALGRLVPGCRKLPFPALLSEASDYIAALEMQVRAMAALAQALSAVSPPP
ncbi:transcription factor bHLH147-like [Triticum urartu]|uniref:transcription factor bHLH147-like n=1 Tax=Triticum urartu TaxID=4572 RepID=UPI0020437A2F|nr:transcription factor bHLH147-like [Triticum urartu]